MQGFRVVRVSAGDRARVILAVLLLCALCVTGRAEDPMYQVLGRNGNFQKGTQVTATGAGATTPTLKLNGKPIPTFDDFATSTGATLTTSSGTIRYGVDSEWLTDQIDDYVTTISGALTTATLTGVSPITVTPSAPNSAVVAVTTGTLAGTANQITVTGGAGKLLGGDATLLLADPVTTALAKAHDQNTDTGSSAPTFTVNNLAATNGTFTNAPWVASTSDIADSAMLFSFGVDSGIVYYGTPLRAIWDGSNQAFGIDSGSTGAWLSMIALNFIGSGAYLTDLAFSQLSGNATVAQGGTGRTTLTSNAVLYGNSTSAVGMLAPNATATNKFLRSVSGGAPSYQQVGFSDLSGSISAPNVLHVETDGNDTTGDGSLSKPLATFAKAVELIEASSETDWLIRLGVGAHTFEHPYTVDGGGLAVPATVFSGKDVSVVGCGAELTSLTLSFSPATAAMASPPDLPLQIVHGVSLTASGSIANYISSVHASSVEWCAVSSSASARFYVYSDLFSHCTITASTTRLLQAIGPMSNVVATHTGTGALALGCSVDVAISDVVVTGVGSGAVTLTGYCIDSSVSVDVPNAMLTILFKQHCSGMFRSKGAPHFTISSSAARPVVLGAKSFGVGTYVTGTQSIVECTGVSQPVILDGFRSEYAGTWAEAAGGGAVAHVQRFNSSGLLTMRNCVFKGTIPALTNSHPNPAVDPGRTSFDQPYVIDGCYFEMIAGIEVGPEDDVSCISDRAQSALSRISNSTFVLNGSASGSSRASGCFSVSSSNAGFAGASSGTNNVEIIGCTLDYRGGPAGSTGRGPLNLIANATGDLANNYNVKLVDCNVKQAGAVDYTIVGKASLATIEGLLVNNAVSTFAETPTFTAISGAALTGVNADQLDGQHGAYYRDAGNLNAGTIPDARFPSTLPAISGANLTNLDAGDLASGKIPDARFPARFPAVDASALTTLNGAAITSGPRVIGTVGPSAELSNFTSLTPFNQSVTIPAADLVANATFDIEASGVHTAQTVPATVGFQISVDSVSVANASLNYGISITGKPFRFRSRVQVLTTGASGTMHSIGEHVIGDADVLDTVGAYTGAIDTTGDAVVTCNQSWTAGSLTNKGTLWFLSVTRVR